MNAGYLSRFFAGVASKRLTGVEADRGRSHQHEYNGVSELVVLFGRATAKHVFPATFVYLTDSDAPVTEEAAVTWYDARRKHASRSEHRLYFPATRVSQLASEGDLLLIGRRTDGTVFVLIAPFDSTVAGQVEWLFGLTPPLYRTFSVRDDLGSEHDRIGFTSAQILEQLGIEIEPAEPEYLNEMIAKFGASFPSTREFSAFARSVAPEVDPQRQPDAALMNWMEHEETLFRTFERHLLAERLAQGFGGDVDGFLRFSLSVQNRRKSRVGLALENHLEVIFSSSGLEFERSAITEGKSRPDFLFPGRGAYSDPAFDQARLTMLAVKSTCKDRWRQVLAEADRIEIKHLLTLEPSLSREQTGQMQQHGVQLVIPESLHTTFRPEQQRQLLTLQQFMQGVPCINCLDVPIREP